MTDVPGTSAETGAAGPPSRWAPVAGYAALAAATQVLWVTYAPITDDAGRHLGVSTGAIGWLAQVFPLLYLVVAVPAGVALDRWFRATLLAGAALTAVGGVLRLAGDDYGWALVGQVVVALGQPLVLNAVTGLAARYLRPADRAAGIAVGSAGTFGGLLIGFGVGAALTGESRVRTVVAVTALIGVAAAAWCAVALRRPGEHRVESAPAGFGAFRLAWRDRTLRRLCALVTVPFGVFVALTTFAQPLLKPAGVGESTAGLVLVGTVVAGVAGCAVVPVRAAQHERRRAVLTVAVIVTATCCLLLAVAAGTVTAFVALAVIGLALLPALPIVLELTERRAGAAEGTAAGLVWLAGNLGGLVLAVAVGLLVHHPSAAFGLLAVLTLVALPLLRPLRLDAVRTGASVGPLSPPRGPDPTTAAPPGRAPG